MKKLSLLAAAMALAAISGGAFAAPTTAQLRGGLVINEILIDPNDTLPANSFDTDANGTSNADDEFVEIYNAGASTISLTGLRLVDPGSGMNYFTFPAASLDAGKFAVVVINVQAGGTLPTLASGNLAFNAAYTGSGGNGLITNSGDHVILYDPTDDEFVQVYFSGGGTNGTSYNPAGSAATIPGTATRVGTSEDWGTPIAGASLTRFPAGDLDTDVHTAVPGATARATPGSEAVSSSDDPNATAPATVFFFPTQLNQTSTKTITISNTGSANTLNISGFAVEPAGPTDYTVLTSFPLAILPGATGTIDVRFNAPATAGDYNETYRLSSNDTSNPTIDIALDAEATDFVAVADVAEARALSGGDDFKITGEVALSLSADRFGSFIGGGGVNRTFPIEDASGAIIAIEIEDDLVLDIAQVGGTRITGLRGRKTFFNSGIGSSIEQVRIYGYDTIASGAALTPSATTPVILRDSADDVEGELIQISGATFTADPNSTGLWDVSTNYEFSVGAELFTVRLQSNRTDLFNTALPAFSTPTDLIGIGYEFGGFGQLSPVAITDLGVVPTSVEGGWNLYQ